MGPYTRQALDEHRATVTARGTSGVHIVAEREPSDGLSHGDRARRLYEQIGTLYMQADNSDNHPSRGTGEPIAEQELADFLGAVRRALASPGGPTATALTEVLRRYERDRTGGAA